MTKSYNFQYALIAISISFGSTAVSYATDTISKPFGQSTIDYIFYNQGEIYNQDNYAAGNASDPGYSTWQLTEAEKNNIVTAGEYWSSVLSPYSANTIPIKVNIGTFSVDSAHAISLPNSTENNLNGYSGMQRLITSNVPMENPAEIVLGIYERQYDEHWSAIPILEDDTTTQTIIHELGHALGILTHTSVTGNYNMLSAYDTHLEDYFGTKLTDLESVNSIVRVTNDAEAQDLHNQGYFVAGDNNTGNYGVWFKGDNVSKVMTINGNLANSDPEYDESNPLAIMNGMIRLQAFEYDGNNKLKPDFSHLELRNSLMSHQYYRNYTSFMEAELAVLQDIGYKIDRRNHYGFSVYNNNITYTNNNPFYKRNSDGTDFVYGTPNTSLLGVGLHLYGSGNKIYQNAELLADGIAGTGIRVDGSSNELSINQDVRVTANGDYGNALLVSYGRNNVIYNYGTLEATGKEGVAARFDFGHNMMKDSDDYRGSYIWTGDMAGQTLPNEINGPLVDAFVVGGTLKGSLASIYISENAYVKNIYFLNGANVQGDIISKWDPDDEDISRQAPENLFTSVNFGLKVINNNIYEDPDFNLILNDDIYGKDSLMLKHFAGRLDLKGDVNAFSIENKGYLAIYKDVNLKYALGNYGTMEIGFYGNGTHNKVNAQSYFVNGSTLVYRLQGGYFQSGKYNLPEHHNPFGDTDISGLKFGATNLDISPTLRFTFDGDRSLIVERPYYAYAQYGLDDNSRSVGYALSYVGDNAYGRMRELITNMDFSDRYGAGIDSTLKQLSPQAIDAGAMVSVLNQQEATYYLNRHIMNQVSSAHNINARGLNFTDFMGFNFNERREKSRKLENSYGWRGYIIPFGTFNQMHSSSTNPGFKDQGFGVLAGADRRITSELSMGFHALLSSHKTKVRNGHDAELNSTGGFLGGHVLYTPESMPGYYLSGMMRFGIEDNRIERMFNAYGMSGQAKGDYKNRVLSLGLQGGRDFYFLKNKNLSMGPVGYLNYSYVYRPSFTESGDFFALKYDSKNTHSLSSSLGGHIDYLTDITDETSFGISFITLWNHEYMDLNTHSHATFRDYDAVGFESTTKLPSRDSLLFQVGLRFNFPSNIFVEATGSYTLRKHGNSVGGLIRAGWEM
jgi:uncharacterized protein YhjY with autotransporter beta-barrel domain